ncbi:hypothetical protein HJA82_29560 [Rhizobium bangladeshense]|uniref:hypothetical protein n=1 Tax=Rhizobium bangladeshense TaxID=1138189 RepID=UPI001C83E928|nr:hypothetical protein [Rhizobium bangladeshense]MBX4911464.1 hypothetical protein [Rhizobium bangladeshense]
MALPTEPLTAFQQSMLNSIDAMISTFGEDGFRTRLAMNPYYRQAGKSQTLRNYTGLTGATTSQIGTDELKVIGWNDLSFSQEIDVLGPEVVLDDPKWPGSRVEVWRKEIDKRDPRNPNPKAGRIVRYEVKGDMMGMAEEFSRLEDAEKRAKELHARAVRKAVAAARADNPNFGRF